MEAVRRILVFCMGCGYTQTFYEVVTRNEITTFKCQDCDYVIHVPEGPSLA